MWILQIRSENDGLDTIYTCSDWSLDDGLRAGMMEVILDNIGNVSISYEGGSRYSIVRDSDRVILAEVWQV